MGSLSLWHWIVVILLVILLFGRGKVSELMGDVAKGIKNFRSGLQDENKPLPPSSTSESVKTEEPAKHG